MCNRGPELHDICLIIPYVVEYILLLCIIALYHPTIFGAYNTLGPSEAWYSTGALYKRPRYETSSTLPIYPQRPGEKDCAHHILTRTCKFGDSCKFDHPVWVPEGGIPNWKEVITYCNIYVCNDQ